MNKILRGIVQEIMIQYALSGAWWIAKRNMRTIRKIRKMMK